MIWVSLILASQSPVSLKLASAISCLLVTTTDWWLSLVPDFYRSNDTGDWFVTGNNDTGDNLLLIACLHLKANLKEKILFKSKQQTSSISSKYEKTFCPKIVLIIHWCSLHRWFMEKTEVENLELQTPLKNRMMIFRTMRGKKISRLTRSIFTIVIWVSLVWFGSKMRPPTWGCPSPWARRGEPSPRPLCWWTPQPGAGQNPSLTWR